MNILKTLAVSAVLALGASSVSAATYTSDGSAACSNLNVDPNSSDCFGTSLGNVQQNAFDMNTDSFDGTVGIFGRTDWEVFQSNGSVEGDDSGEISIVANMFEEVVVFLKSSNEFAAYLFSDGLSDVDLQFWTANDHDLSNYLIAGRGEGISEVPLPASALLLLGGLGGLVAMRRRK